LFVGQLIKLKNVDILLEAASRVPFPLEIELIYHVNTLELELSSLALELGMRERVLFTGALPPEEVCRKYQSADLFVLPSSAEALSSVVMEAMICGTPVVASSVGGIPEQVGPYGILVPPHSVEKLTEAITTLIRNYDQYERMGPEMSSTIQERFSTERMIREHVSLYGELAEGAKHRERRRDLSGRIIGLGAKWLCRMKSRQS
jgi:glycosyltransferase involved in cell wall biosynthesis